MALAIVDPVQDRPCQVHEAPQQIERQVGSLLRYLLGDHRALPIYILHEGPTFMPVDEGPA
jgi:hypothetical protein